MSAHDERALEKQVTAMRPELVGFARKHAGANLLARENEDDLAQSIVLEVLGGAASFEYIGESETRAFVFRVARRHLADRWRYWQALKRSSGKVLRLDWTRTGSASGAVLDAATSQTGPSTFAYRREQLEVAAQTLALLLPRDRELVTWAADGLSLESQAQRLGISYDALVMARSRALQRFQKTFELVRRGSR